MKSVVRFFPLAVMGGMLLAAVAAIVVGSTKFQYSEFDLRERLLFFGMPALMGAVSFIGFKLSADNRLVLAIIACTSGMAIIAADIYVGYQLYLERPVGLTRNDGLNKDMRTGPEVVADLRAKGQDAYPSFHSSYFITQETPGSPYPFEVKINGRSIIPLGGVSNATIVLCKEGQGQWAVFESDEQGFNNPRGIWGDRRIDIAVVGDSFAHGACVAPGKDIASVIREKLPGTLNLGLSGNGPLLMLATIKEFLIELRPQIVIWMFYGGNDISELDIEFGDPVLKKYLKPGTRQGLKKHRDEIDVQIRKFAEPLMRYSTLRRRTGFDWLATVKNSFLLRNIRQRFHLIAQKPDYGRFRSVFQDAITTVESWGGQMVFVYLPSWEEFMGRTNETHSNVMEIVRDLKLSYFDGLDAFLNTGKSERFIYSRPHAHYTEYGYRLIGENLLKFVE